MDNSFPGAWKFHLNLGFGMDLHVRLSRKKVSSCRSRNRPETAASAGIGEQVHIGWSKSTGRVSIITIYATNIGGISPDPDPGPEVKSCIGEEALSQERQDCPRAWRLRKPRAASSSNWGGTTPGCSTRISRRRLPDKDGWEVGRPGRDYRAALENAARCGCRVAPRKCRPFASRCSDAGRRHGATDR